MIDDDPGTPGSTECVIMSASGDLTHILVPVTHAEAHEADDDIVPIERYRMIGNAYPIAGCGLSGDRDIPAYTNGAE
jgi:hypothetical protein